MNTKKVGDSCFWIGAYGLIMGALWYWLKQPAASALFLLIGLGSTSIGLCIAFADLLVNDKQ